MRKTDCFGETKLVPHIPSSYELESEYIIIIIIKRTPRAQWQARASQDRKANLDCGLQGLAPSFHIQCDCCAHTGVQCVLQGQEVSHNLALYSGDDVSRLQQAFCKAAWHNAVYYQHAGACAVYCACRIASAEYG